MPRRNRNRDRAAQPAASHPGAELRGQDENGNVRPADDRYLTEEQIEQRDAYRALVENGGDQ